MPNFDLLDNIIALVVVILLLSLIVQSLQGLVKKVFSLKSKQIEASLLDLFESVLREERSAEDRTLAEKSKKPDDKTPAFMPRARTMTAAHMGWRMILPRAFAPLPNTNCGPNAKALLAAVKGEMQELGRVDPGGRFLVDSLSKTDLLNVIARVAPDAVVMGLTANLGAAMKKVNAIQEAIADVKAEKLPGEANALFAKLQEALAPLQVHCRRLTIELPQEVPSDDALPLRPNLVVADVLALREVVFNDTLDLLGKAQQVLAAQKADPSSDNATHFKEATEALAKVASAINAARQSLDDAIGGFKAKLEEVESWFDTVMQGFEERYHRGMRTYSFILAAIVVILLNANVFAIYKSIAGSEVLRKSLVTNGTQIAKLQEDIAKLEAKQAPTTVDQADLAANKKELDGLVDRYTSYGFQPLTWQQLGTWARDFRTWDGDWLDSRGQDIRTLLGWLVMTLLLSFGAPFWHDALESLFGVKNLLRKRNEQRNVEQARGAGNPAT